MPDPIEDTKGIQKMMGFLNAYRHVRMEMIDGVAGADDQLATLNQAYRIIRAEVSVEVRRAGHRIKSQLDSSAGNLAFAAYAESARTLLMLGEGFAVAGMAARDARKDLVLPAIADALDDLSDVMDGLSDPLGDLLGDLGLVDDLISKTGLTKDYVLSTVDHATGVRNRADDLINRLQSLADQMD